jgi:hypothetical protein
MRTIFNLIGGASVTALAFAGPAIASDDPPDCAWSQQLHRFKALDDQTVVFKVNDARTYRVTFANKCIGLRVATSLQVEPFAVCLRPGTLIRVSSPGQGYLCRVELVELVPPETPPAPPPSN